MADLMTIGKFAAMTRISIRMLRYYDERGLLRPARVDRATGYRYYHVDQAAIAEIIRLLRVFEMPLDEIARALGDSDSAGLATALARHRDRIETELEEKRRSLAYLDQLISHVERKGDFPHDDGSLREFEAQHIISRRERRTLDDVGVFTGQTIGRLYGMARKASIGPVDAPFSIYGLPDDDGDGFIVEVCLPLTRSLSVPPPFIARQTTGGLHAVLIHTGPYESLGAAYRALGIWLVQNDLEPAGPPREVYLTAPGPDLDPNAYQTLLAWPVEASPPAWSMPATSPNPESVDLLKKED